MSEILWYESIDSTNSEASRLFEGLDNLSVVAAYDQSAGRGQGDHVWYSSPGLNLCFSIVLKCREYGLRTSEQQVLSCIATLAIRNYLLSKGVESRIKWPNDIWVGDRKICGVLVQNRETDGELEGSVIGIGLNLNETDWPEWIPNPVSLTGLTGIRYDVRSELELLYDEFCRLEPLLRNADGRNQLQEEFGKYVFRLS